jgi:DNA polymerase/3'-5' exonuclease PolX
MNLHDAQPIADRVLRLLAPYCVRVEIAGSIRREKPEVGDIEIVAIPRTVRADDLFGGGDMRRSPAFAQRVNGLGTIDSGCPTAGKYIKIQLPDGIQLDLFLAHEDNWGLILAIRTGSADYSHEVLAKGWVRAGYHSLNGMLCSKAHKIPVREERDLFDLIGLPWVDPKWRTF